MVISESRKVELATSYYLHQSLVCGPTINKRPLDFTLRILLAQNAMQLIHTTSGCGARVLWVLSKADRATHAIPFHCGHGIFCERRRIAERKVWLVGGFQNTNAKRKALTLIVNMQGDRLHQLLHSHAARYAFLPLSGQRASSSAHNNSPCNSVHLRIGDPPPIAAYCFAILGARRRAIHGARRD